jgi:hypothetical protein
VAQRRFDRQLAARGEAEGDGARMAQAMQRSSVTRATAAKRIPLRRQTVSKIVGMIGMRPMAAKSSVIGPAVSSIGSCQTTPPVSRDVAPRLALVPAPWNVTAEAAVSRPGRAVVTAPWFVRRGQDA